MRNFWTGKTASNFLCGRIRTQNAEGFLPLEQLVSRGITTSITLKAVHGFEDSGKLINKQKIVEEKEARKERKNGRRKICDQQAKKNAEAKELIPMPILYWTDVWSF